MIAKILKWFTLALVAIFVVGILYVRYSRMLDYSFSGNSDSSYILLNTDFSYEDIYFNIDSVTKIHGVLFKSDSVKTIATIYHHLGQGLSAEYTLQFYKPLLENGFQIFAIERRGDGNSIGVSNHLLTLKDDALTVFDEFVKRSDVETTPILIWGQSLGGAFATMNAAERNDKIDGLILEGTFNSLTSIAQHFIPKINI